MKTKKKKKKTNVEGNEREKMEKEALKRLPVNC